MARKKNVTVGRYLQHRFKAWLAEHPGATGADLARAIDRGDGKVVAKGTVSRILGGGIGGEEIIDDFARLVGTTGGRLRIEAEEYAKTNPAPRAEPPAGQEGIRLAFAQAAKRLAGKVSLADAEAAARAYGHDAPPSPAVADDFLWTIALARRNTPTPASAIPITDASKRVEKPADARKKA